MAYNALYLQKENVASYETLRELFSFYGLETMFKDQFFRTRGSWLQEWSIFTHVTSSHIGLLKQNKYLQKKRVQFPED